mmetsp:Transcript_13729/g.42543  ORF Transcript_13729/g.42543 Transcript_13729/m.42543 type:complete len:318 (+) Transcript_13729:466-1419(+)
MKHVSLPPPEPALDVPAGRAEAVPPPWAGIWLHHLKKSHESHLRESSRVESRRRRTRRHRRDACESKVKKDAARRLVVLAARVLLRARRADAQRAAALLAIPLRKFLLLGLVRFGLVVGGAVARPVTSGAALEAVRVRQGLFDLVVPPPLLGGRLARPLVDPLEAGADRTFIIVAVRVALRVRRQLVHAAALLVRIVGAHGRLGRRRVDSRRGLGLLGAVPRPVADAAAAEALARRLFHTFDRRFIVGSREGLGRGALLGVLGFVLGGGGVGGRLVVLGLLGDHRFLLVRVDVPGSIHGRLDLRRLLIARARLVNLI